MERTTRRAFLQSAPLTAVALSAPAIAAVPKETVAQKIERLVSELKAAMNEQSPGDYASNVDTEMRFVLLWDKNDSKS